MTLESLADFFRSDSSRQPLQRIYLAQKIQTAVYEQLGEEVRVVMKSPKIFLYCQTPIQATILHRKLKRLYGIVTGVMGENKLTITVRVDATRL